MKIKAHISFDSHNLLYDDMETPAGGDDCEIEIDDNVFYAIINNMIRDGRIPIKCGDGLV